MENSKFNKFTTLPDDMPSHVNNESSPETDATGYGGETLEEERIAAARAAARRLLKGEM